MAEGDRAAVDIKFALVDLARGTLEAEYLLAEFFVVPSREAAEHLGGKGLVQLPGLDVLQGQIVALEQRSCRQHRAEPHDGGIERGPLAVDDGGLRRQAV